MTTCAETQGLITRNAYGRIEAIAIEVNRVGYDKKADFGGEVPAIVEKELPKQIADAFEATFGR
ncbi:hypothetical protein ACG873_23275 [Mesorhizobium sp. AaZ16]|uniref:hypothetical protein n=1 Tax=Mesorhizobium sp. AaZ16 TaxID=3402289 RepID=UPI00374F9D1D